MPRVARSGDIVLPFQVTYRTLSNAEVLALNGTPVKVVSGEPGYAVIPVFATAFKEAGTAFVIGAATGLQIRAGSATGAILGQFTLAGLVDQAAVATGVVFGPASATVTLPAIANLALTGAGGDYLGTDLFAFMAGGNLTTGTSTIRIVVFYYLFPLNFSAIG